jgi:hypothetical protein
MADPAELWGEEGNGTPEILNSYSSESGNIV